MKTLKIQVLSILICGCLTANATDRQDYAKRLLSLYAHASHDGEDNVMASSPPILSLAAQEERPRDDEKASSSLDKKEGGDWRERDFLGTFQEEKAAANEKQVVEKGTKALLKSTNVRFWMRLTTSVIVK